MQNELRQIAKAIAIRRWRVWEWFNGKIDQFFSMKSPIMPDSLSDIWHNVLSGNLKDGDYLQIKKKAFNAPGWYLNDWVPKAPGQSWIQDPWFTLSPDEICEGLSSQFCDYYKLKDGIKHLLIKRLYGSHSFFERQYISEEFAKINLIKQGFGHRLGCFRPTINSEDTDRYCLLSLCSTRDYFIDLSFPVMISEQVYRKYRENQLGDNSVEFEGILMIKEIDYSDYFSSYIKTIGAQECETIKELTITPFGLPRLVGWIVSPLDTNFKSHDTQPFMTLRVDGYNDNQLSSDYILMISRFMVLNPCQRENEALRFGFSKEHKYGLDFFLGEDIQFGTTMNPITDFDGRIKHYACEYPISLNPVKIMPFNE